MKNISNKRTFNLTNKIKLEDYINLHKNANNNNNIENIQDKNEKLLIYVLTYNIHGGIPKEEQISLLFPNREELEKFDIFVINTQECLRSIGASLFVDSKEPWLFSLTKFFGEKYINIIDSNLGALHIAIFIKKEKAMNFHDLRKGEIKTGFLNIMANKGAVSTSMKYCDKNILFICCHLAAGQEKKEERNNDLKRIDNYLQNTINYESKKKLTEIKKSLVVKDKQLLSATKSLRINNLNGMNINQNKVLGNTVGLMPTKSLFIKRNENEFNEIENEEEQKKEEEQKNEEENNNRYNINKENNENENNKMNNNDGENDNSFESIVVEKDKKDKTMEDYDFVILSGDLNYRLNLKNNEISEIMNKKNPEILWDKDQLNSEIKEKHNFREGTINFMPTYKFKDNSNDYDYSRVPGWTDRILYKSKKFYDIMLCEYSSINNILISDHRPVYAIFKINFRDSVFNNDKYHKNQQECFII